MRSICLKCIDDKFLYKIVRKDAIKVLCHYCKNRSLGVKIEKLAEIVDEYIRSYCCLGGESPIFDDESDKIYTEQDGQPLLEFIQIELGIDFDPAKDLIQILKENDPSDPRDGGESFYSDEQNYVRKEISSGEYRKSWRFFTERVKHQRRFFDEDARAQLAAILGEANSAMAAELPVMEIGLGTKINLLFRARSVNSDQEAHNILINPMAKLGPPPLANAIGGRMNSVGIPVFYGALSEETALAEVRPFVGSLVVVGEFSLSKKFRLLNLPQIHFGFGGSIFQPDYENRAARLRFLEVFHRLIARPIQPSDEFLEYIPTQAVAEYVANVLEFDGIVYASAQVGAVSDEPESHLVSHKFGKEELAQHNVVLFSKSTPALIYKKKSAHVVRVKGINHIYERLFFPSEI